MVDASSRLCKYNMTVDFMRKHFSGLLLVKETPAGTYRTLFSTHFGLSLFDFEIGRDTLIVHHCVAPLKKKKILRLLQKDFSILFGLNLLPEEKALVYTCPASPALPLVYRFISDGSRCYYRLSATTGKVREIHLGSGQGKTTFLALADSTGQGGTIRIRYMGMGLKIGLEEL